LVLVFKIWQIKHFLISSLWVIFGLKLLRSIVVDLGFVLLFCSPSFGKRVYNGFDVVFTGACASDEHGNDDDNVQSQAEELWHSCVLDHHNPPSFAKKTNILIFPIICYGKIYATLWDLLIGI
jgi:hypothetical protein